MPFLPPAIRKNDKLAKRLIGVFSIVVFVVIVLLSRVKLKVDPGFDIHIFAAVNAVINSIVALMLLAALAAVKLKNYRLHKGFMMVSLVLSILFLLSYIAHHLLAGDTKFGGVGSIRIVYFVVLITHIFLAAIILPFILFTAYRGLTSEFRAHKKLARITWPLRFYVAVSGPVLYLMIRPYYT